jgi:hypothetical protein
MATYYANVPKTYQMAVNFSKWIQNMYTKHFTFQGPSKCTQIGIFGIKINHLATLPLTRNSDRKWHLIWVCPPSEVASKYQRLVAILDARLPELHRVCFA